MIRLAAFFVITLSIPGISFAESLTRPADDDLRSLIGTLPVQENEIYQVTDEDFFPLLEYAMAHEINLFELLNLAYLELERRNWRLSFCNQTLEAIERVYNIGGSKMHIVFPFEIMERMEIGAALSAGQNALDVYIEKEYFSDFYGFGILHEETHFGFETIELNYFRGAFGMKAKRSIFTFKVSHIELYEPRHVAIHLNNFFKPKRETFWAVRKQR